MNKTTMNEITITRLLYSEKKLNICEFKRIITKECHDSATALFFNGEDTTDGFITDFALWGDEHVSERAFQRLGMTTSEVLWEFKTFMCQPMVWEAVWNTPFGKKTMLVSERLHCGIPFQISAHNTIRLFTIIKAEYSRKFYADTGDKLIVVSANGTVAINPQNERYCRK